MKSERERRRSPEPTLHRTVGLPLAVLYGLGVTVGAGIYVLIGVAAGRAGPHAPLSFLLAAIVMGLTAATFAELVGRYPVSSGEAAYVQAAFHSNVLALTVGFLVVTAATIATAAIAHGAAGYVSLFVDLPLNLLVLSVLAAMGGIAMIGISTSATIAGIMTLIELAGLIAIIVLGAWKHPEHLRDVAAVWPAVGDGDAWSGVLAAMLLAFFAFIGFEGLVNIAEEVKAPEKTLPRAIFLTLAIATVLYISVAWVALRLIPRADLAASKAPLSLVFERITGASPHVVTAIAINATLNGIIAQIVFASRVLYGLGKQGALPQAIAHVNATTQTPIRASVLVTGFAMVVATIFPIERLAAFTSLITLVVFCVVNLSLLAIKWRKEPAHAGVFVVPLWIPAAGALTCMSLFLIGATR